ncbi:MAG: ribosome small subunit-dependent GTPase A [Lachnospiraceae bacterium]|nr:ribosome small subunit-dependent GTPase A [Lachnospiraceae bacterium]
MVGKIVKGVGGLYDVSGENGIYHCRARGIFRNKKEKPLVGDIVDYFVTSETDREGSITAIHERKNRLIRPETANVDLILLMFSIRDPEPNFDMLNRYLIMMKDAEIETALAVTKMDLAGGNDALRIREAFKNTGMEIFFLSVKEGSGIDELKAFLPGKTTALAGPSGVGKSSFLNRLLDREAMETGTLSEKIRRGKNTTRHSEIFLLDEKTFIFDTPGFTSVDITYLNEENLQLYFPEFEPFIGGCYYNSCRHVKEPGCRVKEAVEDGSISRFRYESYVKIYEELKQIRRY